MSMAGEMVDGCIPSKMGQEDMEEGWRQGWTSLDINSQPATQHLYTSFAMESLSQGVMDGDLGQLYPHCGTCPRLALSQDIFKLGRANTCEYVIREISMGTQSG